MPYPLPGPVWLFWKLTGCGEFTQCANNYILAHSEGVAATVRLMAPDLSGEDPRRIAAMDRKMDAVVQGHGYAKSTTARCSKSMPLPTWS